MLTYQGLQTEMLRLSSLLDSGIDTLIQFSRDFAVAEDTYRMARARAYLASSGTVDERKAQADLATSTERLESHTLDGLRQAALEAVRSRRQQISALQSLAGAFRAEAEYGRTSPNIEGGTR